MLGVSGAASDSVVLRICTLDRHFGFSRTVFFGRIIHCEEFGVPRQALFVCTRSKILHNHNYVPFKPINGKLPPIQVPWNKANPLPSSVDLHIVEVASWSDDRLPRGRYVECLRMQSRNSDSLIMEPVQLSLNFSDWKRGDVRQKMKLSLGPNVLARL